MKMVQKLSLLAATLALVSCNEKVSPALQNSNVVVATPTPTPTTDTEYSFSIVNKSSENLGYKVHKTGAGNAAAECKVSNTNTPLSNATFGNASNDITCYFEAEEMSLYNEGFSFSIEATKNTCEFITYQPFSYYNRQPGDSTGTYKKITCTNDDTTSAKARAALVSGGARIEYDPDGFGATQATAQLGCGQYASESPLINDSVTPLNTQRGAFTLDETQTEAELCRFNYLDKDQDKCDIGVITINDHQVTFDTSKASTAADTAGKSAGVAAGNTASTLYATYTDNTDDDAAGPDDGVASISAAEKAAIEGEPAYQTAYNTAYNSTYATTYANYPATYKIVPKKITCGGKIANCIQGPIRKHTTAYPSWTLNHTQAKNVDFSQMYSYETLLPNRDGNFIYANYRRDLANRTIPFIDSADPGYGSAYIDQKTFDPTVMHNYSRNVDTGINNAAWDAASIESLLYSARPYAADPFLGMTVGAKSYATSPFYTFECLDKAREPKARIRMVVRDWNRIFPTGLNEGNLELLTDTYFDNFDPSDVANWGRMDETALDPYDNDSFNDYYDWDDTIFMRRTTGPLVLAPIFNHFNQANFPEEFLQETP